MSADNQQERLKTIGWITGFIDGEGCFSISIFRNKTSKLGWQIFPELAVTQGEKSLSSLNLLKEFFGCGKIFVNRRHDNHKDFEHFVDAVEIMKTGKHLSLNGLRQVARISSKMNRKKPSVFLESPETIRQTPTHTSKKI